MSENYNGYGGVEYQQAPQQQYQQPQRPQGTQPVSGWSWGAFMFNYAWGLGNGVYVMLLSLFPLATLIMMILGGIKGHEWAMNSGKFRTVEEFNAVQESWDRAGKIVFFISLGICVLSFLLSILGVGLLSGLMRNF